MQTVDRIQDKALIGGEWVPARSGRTFEVHLRRQANHDELTGLPNRTPIVEHLDAALRDRVRAVVDPNVGEASADVTVTCKDGRRLHLFVAEAIGSTARPMTDADLARKFHGLVDPVLGSARADGLLAACNALGGSDDVRTLTALACA